MMQMNKRQREIYNHFERLRKQMSLQDWRVRYSWNRDEENFATCKPAPQYKEADINVDIERYNDPTRSLAEDARHELAHMLLGELGAMAYKLCGDSKVLKELWDDAEDRAATHIARMKIWSE